MCGLIERRVLEVNPTPASFVGLADHSRRGDCACANEQIRVTLAEIALSSLQSHEHVTRGRQIDTPGQGGGRAPSRKQSWPKFRPPAAARTATPDPARQEALASGPDRHRRGRTGARLCDGLAPVPDARLSRPTAATMLNGFRFGTPCSGAARLHGDLCRGGRLLVPRRLHTDDLRGLPVRMAGRRPLHGRCRNRRCDGAVSGRALGLWRLSQASVPVRPSAKLAAGFESNAFSYLLVLRIAPFFPFFVVNIAPALFNVRLKTFVDGHLDRHPARDIRLCLARPGRRQRARRCRDCRARRDRVGPGDARDHHRLRRAGACRCTRDDCKEGLGAA